MCQCLRCLATQHVDWSMKRSCEVCRRLRCCVSMTCAGCALMLYCHLRVRCRRVIGYYMGVEDGCNPCTSMATARSVLVASLQAQVSLRCQLHERHQVQKMPLSRRL
jgi:hypothetical protein